MEKLTKSQKWICGIVLTLGVISAVLGFVAESKRIKSTDIHIVDGECKYPASSALILGVVAALVLLLAQIIISVVGGCICCTPSPPGPHHASSASNRSIAVICLVACWITFLNAFALLMAGASLNNQRQEYMWFGGQCNVVKPLVFAGGALLALATVVLGLIFYLASSAAKAAANAARLQPGIALGQPAYGLPYTAYGPPPISQSYPYSHFPQYGHPASMPTSGPPPPFTPAFPTSSYPDVVTGYPKQDPPPPTQGNSV
ncbi:hypothetical protein R1sor_001993 [Riccia sorocarpa]|uniref:Uncharacterized protein n=1 Tax=Riccia sorocarpa TaxID=122646 RepID=A0ABD3GZH7_9MARC